MDEQIEKLIALAGNNNRYQYFTLIIITFLWVNCNYIAIIIPFIEREPLINYYDSEGDYHSKETLTNEICDLYKEREETYEIVERFTYSWVSEFDIECEKMDISLIGIFIFIGNTAGSIVFSIINKFISHKKILIISSFGYCIAIFLNTLIKSYTYFYCILACLVFIGTFGNCLCYSSLVLAEEIVSSDKRSLFGSIINAGYALSGVFYSLAFWFFQDWRIVFYICIGGSAITLFLIWVFIFDSPRVYINKKDLKNSIRILEGIASFNGKLEEFRESIKQDEYQETINAIKGIPIEEMKSGNIENGLQKHIYNQEYNNKETEENNEDENKDDDEKNQENEKNNENLEIKENLKENIDENLDIYRESNKEIFRESNKDNRDTDKNINRVSDRDTKTNSNKDSIRDSAKDNKDHLNEPLVRHSTSGRVSKIQDINIWSLFKYKSIRYKFIILNILWIGTKASFNGIAISSKSFPGNFYINIIILYVIEGVSYTISGWIIDFKEIGRKGALWIQYIFIIISFILLLFINFGITPELILNFIARFSVAGTLVIYFTYTIEVYPTLVRSFAFGLNLTFGNIGAIVVPYLFEYVNYKLFLLIIIAICILNSLLLIFIPETVGMPINESIKELDD